MENLAELLTSSYAKLVGGSLVPDDVADAAAWLYGAPFGLLAHDTSPDPVFVYANRTAQEHFEYGWDEFVGLPSRLSAGEEDRDARAALLDAVRRQGYTNDYRGPRVAKSGRRFWIDDVTVWNLITPTGDRVGQAALIRRWSDA
ncbi:MEKHLA domain-containing protein [Cryptosporangium sp. NPDC048952]|uniref:MEKHLA domain-containing protein n=1 Tax=Cryptosporangium sp. NPDC048952 TaxID=3363961 RepID=UPI0037240FA2